MVDLSTGLAVVFVGSCLEVEWSSTAFDRVVVPLVATGLTVIAGLCSAKGTATDDDEVVLLLTLGLEGLPM